MPSAGARGAARGGALTTEPGTGAAFRCSIAAEARHDDLAGTATHVAGFLLIENHGPWGVSAVRDSRLPEPLKQHLARAPKAVKVLLARRHHRADRQQACSAFLALPRRRVWLRRRFTDPLDLLDLDLEAVLAGELPGAEAGWEPAPGRIFGVCTHGRHDACCAERGRPVAAALCATRPEETWEVSHIGGDRFSANMVVLPEGLYYGRMDAEVADEVASLVEQGRLDLTRLRGSSTIPMAVQHAEIALRRHLGEDRTDAVRVTRREGDATVFTCEGRDWRVVVRRHLAEAVKLTCGAERLNPVPVFELVAIEPA